MTVGQPNINGYLMRISRTAIVRESEKAAIQRSLGRLRILLRRTFKKAIIEHFVFGSYSRSTILPRRLDEASDVDLMVVFEEDGARPQTYLDRLRRFAHNNYSQSEIRQSHPTVQLNLNHMTFEIVPSLKAFWTPYKIPSKASDFEEWVNTDPQEFNESLTAANKQHKNLIKPLVRIMKYWNATSGHPFDSYVLEQSIVEHIENSFYLMGPPRDIKGYLYDFVEEGLPELVSWTDPKWKKDAVDRLDKQISVIRDAEKNLRVGVAIDQLQKILPPTWPYIRCP